MWTAMYVFGLKKATKDTVSSKSLSRFSWVTTKQLPRHLCMGFRAQQSLFQGRLSGRHGLQTSDFSPNVCHVAKLCSQNPAYRCSGDCLSRLTRTFEGPTMFFFLILYCDVDVHFFLRVHAPFWWPCRSWRCRRFRCETQWSVFGPSGDPRWSWPTNGVTTTTSISKRTNIPHGVS